MCDALCWNLSYYLTHEEFLKAAQALQLKDPEMYLRWYNAAPVCRGRVVSRPPNFEKSVLIEAIECQTSILQMLHQAPCLNKVTLRARHPLGTILVSAPCPPHPGVRTLVSAETANPATLRNLVATFPNLENIDMRVARWSNARVIVSLIKAEMQMGNWPLFQAMRIVNPITWPVPAHSGAFSTPFPYQLKLRLAIIKPKLLDSCPYIVENVVMWDVWLRLMKGRPIQLPASLQSIVILMHDRNLPPPIDSILSWKGTVHLVYDQYVPDNIDALPQYVFWTYSRISTKLYDMIRLTPVGGVPPVNHPFEPIYDNVHQFVIMWEKLMFIENTVAPEHSNSTCEERLQRGIHAKQRHTLKDAEALKALGFTV